MGLNILFNVQGEGRGHMTQAIALAGMLRSAGHEIVGTMVGNGEDRTIPEFFRARMDCEMTRHASPTIKLSADSRSIDAWQTSMSAGRLMMDYVDSVASMERDVRRFKPDVVVNFYDPLFGFLSPDSTPRVAIAHQYMFHHSRYPFTCGTRLQRQGMMLFTRFTAMGAQRLLALSLYPADDLPAHNLRVVPPILREELFSLKASETQPPFLLVYLWRPELLDEIREWCEDDNNFEVHCFLDHPEKKEEDRVLDNLVLHHLNDRLFLKMMSRCSGVATTAGFETTAEAMWLEKPLLMVPTHIEQQCNALDASLIGGAYSSSMFDLGRLQDVTPRDQTSFREWVDQAESIIVREIETVAKGLPMDNPVSSQDSDPTMHSSDGLPRAAEDLTLRVSGTPF